MGFNKIGLEFDRAIVGNKSSIQIARVASGNAQIVVGSGKIGLGGDRLGKMLKSFVKLTNILQHIAQIAPHFGEFWL